MAVYSSLCTLVHGPFSLATCKISTYTTVQRKKMHPPPHDVKKLLCIACVLLLLNKGCGKTMEVPLAIVFWSRIMEHTLCLGHL